MPSAYSIAANALYAICEATFPDVPVVHDKVHEAVGYKGARIGIAPIRQPMNARNKLVQETWIEIRFMGAWNKEVTPDQQVDPRTVAEQAELLMAAIRQTDVTVSGEMWYFNVEQIDYPDDPTGNKTRFYMTLRAWGNNSSLVETTA
jgi:hypothetical protein